MRPDRTTSEEAVIAIMKSALEARGHAIIDDETITDRPDWVFLRDGTRVAAECRCINLEVLMKWTNTNRNLEPNRCYEIIVPDEPHLWINKAVSEKEGKVEKYRERACASEAWLLVHSEFPAALALFEADPNTLELMRKASAALKTEFDQIWLVHPECGAILLRDNNTPPCLFPTLNLSKGYPTISNKKANGTITSTGLTINMCANPSDIIKIQPLDNRYRV